MTDRRPCQLATSCFLAIQEPLIYREYIDLHVSAAGCVTDSGNADSPHKPRASSNRVVEHSQMSEAASPEPTLSSGPAEQIRGGADRSEKISAIKVNGHDRQHFVRVRRKILQYSTSDANTVAPNGPPQLLSKRDHPPRNVWLDTDHAWLKQLNEQR